MGKPGRKKDHRFPPTVEALRHGDYSSAGMAYRRIPIIDTMLERGQITEQQHISLGYYRDQASTCSASPRSCLDRSVRTGDRGPSMATLSATLETARIERALGPLRDIARAIAVQDISLSQWCISQYGGRERYGPSGNFIAIVPNFERRAMKLATDQIREAARRIVR